jgi:1-acyl-sn-glycerol-3-phosphate acyltransferase
VRPKPPKGPERTLARMAVLVRALTMPFVRYEIRGGRCATELSHAVIAANHRSMFDVLAGLVCLHHFGHYPRLLIERRYVERGVVGWFARGIGAIPVDRGGRGGDALATAKEALDDGIDILVMPEGRLHWDPDDPLSTGPAHTGVSRLVTEGHHPVVPAALAGTERILPAGRKIPRFVPLRRKVVACVVADDPIHLDGDDHRANTDRVMAAIRELLAEAQPLVRGQAASSASTAS